MARNHKNTAAYQPPITRRESLLMRISGALLALSLITMCLSITSAIPGRLLTLIVTALNLILMLGMLLVPELRDYSDRKAVESLPFMTCVGLLLSGLMLPISSAMMASVPGYLKYVKWGLFALLIAVFWLISSSYRTSFLRFIGVTLALALFAFNIPEALNCALDASSPVEAQAVIVEMNVTAPTRKGKTVKYRVEAEIDGSRLTIPMTSLDFGHYTEGDSLTLQRYEGAFGIPYYDYIPGSR